MAANLTLTEKERIAAVRDAAEEFDLIYDGSPVTDEAAQRFITKLRELGWAIMKPVTHNRRG